MFVFHASRDRVGVTMFNDYTSGTGWSPAWGIMSAIVESNARGVYPRIRIDEDETGVHVLQGWDSTIGVMYRYLFDLIVGGAIEECRECRTPINQTDARQRFCPPPPWTRESQCAMRFHKREQRRRRQAQADSERTP
jgi:hypothetical protein